MYRPPSQNNDEFEVFLSNMEKLLNDINKHKPSLSVIISDFNGRSSHWWCKDINTTEGSNLLSLTSLNGFSQLINERTHIQANSSSCTDLILTDQPNLSMNCGVHHHYTRIAIIILFILDLILIFTIPTIPTINMEL